MGMGMSMGGMAMGQGFGGGMVPPLNFGGSPQPQAYQMPLMGQQQQQQPQQAQPTPPQTTATTTPAAASGQQSKDPFADLAGLF